MEKDSQSQESESTEKVGSGEEIIAGAGNAMPLVTIELTLYCQVVPHQVPGELVPELRMAGGGDPLKGLNTAEAKLQMQLKQK